MFYEKIKVPLPTFCPDCRLQRREASYNTMYLYKRKCDLCAKEVVSRYSPDKKYRVYCPHCWWGDGWDALQYGRDYDFTRSFFEQFKELWHEAPLLGLSVDLQSAIESPYTNNVGYLKQCYLLFKGSFNERCLYGYLLVHVKDSVDTSFTNSSELLYDSHHCFKNYHGIYLNHTTHTHNSAFLWQSINCQNCFGSANLRNKQYYFFNQPLGKEAYEEKIKSIDLGSYENYCTVKKQIREHWLRYPVKTFWREFSTNCSGIYVFQSKNCQHCFENMGTEDGKYVSFIETPPVKDCYDYTGWGDGAELVYEAMVTGEKVRNVKFGVETGLGLADADYTTLCTGSSNLLGCVSVRGKSHCILNKQYTREEYKKLIPKIIQHLNESPYRDKVGREYKYGEFFPIELSPFAYNETQAQANYPLSREEAERNGYQWKELTVNEYRITLRPGDIPDHVKNVQDSITEEIIGCKCGRAFRIIFQELAFYRKMNVPLPRQCFYCRLAEKMKDQPHPLKFWERQCQCVGERSENGVYRNTTLHFHGPNHCPNKFETSYAKERPEIVYCEQCYNEETT